MTDVSLWHIDETRILNEVTKTLIETWKALVTPVPPLVNAEKVTLPYYMTATGPEICPELIFNQYAERPPNLTGTVNVYDAASFCEYFSLFADIASRVAADEVKNHVVAILDYHEPEGKQPRWGKHKLYLTLRHSPEWLAWSAKNNVQMEQQHFAEFLEQNSIDIAQPSPAAMMEVARDLQATTEVEFGAGVWMQDQVRFKYTETTKSSVGALQLAVPARFVIDIPVFIGGEKMRIEALLRFRVNQGKLKIFYTLVRPEECIRLAFISSRDAIAEKLSITIINGNFV